MPVWIRFILAGLAAYRLAQLVTIDEGPPLPGHKEGVFTRLRTWGGVYDRGQNGMPLSARGKLLACPYCIGMYLSAGVAVLALVPTRIGDFILSWWALAGLQTYLQGPRRPS